MGVLQSTLYTLFSKTLNANSARLHCLSFLISAVLRHRTVNLAILSTTDDGRDVSNETRYRRLQDFFLNAKLCFHSIGKLIVSRVPKPQGGYVLAMDRTNWRFGRTDISFLVISIVTGSASIPLVWKVLPKKTKRGNSKTNQRIALTRKLLKLLPADQIHVITMDREFLGQAWLTWLDQRDIPFVVRIKTNTQIGGRSALSFARSSKYTPLEREDSFGLKLFFARKNLGKGTRYDQLLVLSNRFSGVNALELYRKRWGIERLFWHLKQKGFDLEATHITDAKKLDKLFAVLALAFLLTFAWGSQIRAQASRLTKQT